MEAVVVGRKLSHCNSLQSIVYVYFPTKNLMYNQCTHCLERSAVKVFDYIYCDNLDINTSINKYLLKIEK